MDWFSRDEDADDIEERATARCEGCGTWWPVQPYEVYDGITSCPSCPRDGGGR